MKIMMTSNRALVLIALMLTMHLNIFGDSFDSLWRKAKEAEEKDLPKTQLEILDKIATKAERQRAYGQLMTAELKMAQVSCVISPDSLAPAVKRMEARAEAVADVPLRAVYFAVLGRIYADNGELAPGEAYGRSQSYYRRAMESPCELARVKAGKYKPLVTTGADSRIFGDDLLSLIGIWTGDYKTLHEYYDSVGNRRAACLTALELIERERPYGRVEMRESRYLGLLDSLIARYGDLQEAGQVALERYSYMDRSTDATAAEKLDYLHEALGQWPAWKGIGELRNAEKQLTQSQFMARMEEKVTSSTQYRQIILSSIRNIDQLNVKFYRVAGDGTLNLNPAVAKDYAKLKPLLTPMPERTITRDYGGRKNYELFEDTVTLDPLPTGIYMVEIGSDTSGVGKERRLINVSNLRLMSQGLPGGAQRLVVVDAMTGHPVAGATLRITVRNNQRGKTTLRTVSLTTNADGEATHTLGEKDYVVSTFVYSDDDNALPEVNGAGYYQFSPSTDAHYTDVFTDRSIYRPGQTVHVASITYGVSNSIRQKVEANVPVQFELYGANHRRLDAKTAVTDQWGTATVDFTLPTEGLTGNFTINAGGEASCTFKVEEYKRPTFEVTFDKVGKAYEPGDTVTVRGKAMSYAGVPVQQAKVSYTVARRRAWWWWRYNSYYETLSVGNSRLEDVIVQGETTTDVTGGLSIDVPMILPEADHPLFYNIIVRADVTDQGGETHRGETQLALGNRKTAFGCTLERQVLIDEQPKFMFTYNNASGFEIDGTVSYRVDQQPWQEARTNSELALPRLDSGAHTVEAICGSDTLKRELIVFSLDDEKPCTNTDDWFYVEDTRFRDTKSPLTLQVGSSRSDVYIYYNVFAADSVLESGHVVRSNELVNRKLTYRPEYGDAVLLTFAWVKDGKCYHHTATIERPLPRKDLKLEWKTFRDRLKPGQQEQWTLIVSTPDGKPADAQLMATLYDQSLDQLYPHGWSLVPRYRLTRPNVDWLFRRWGGLSFSAYRPLDKEKVEELHFTTFDESLFPTTYRFRRYRMSGAVLPEHMLESQPMMMAKGGAVDTEVFNSSNDEAATRSATNATADMATEAKETSGDTEGTVQLRENLSETAFFYPQLSTDARGCVAISFTLPESLTTWRFMGVAHTKDMFHGMITSQAIAQKDVMAQPNVPRFVRHGDQATVALKLFNTSGHSVSGTARLELIDPETERVVYSDSQPFSLDTDATTTATFTIDTRQQHFQGLALLVCRATAVGKGFSDGEQHYLPLLPSSERVTVSRPFTQNEPGTTTIDLTQLVPADARDGKLTVEYTNNPAWLIVQALPTMSVADEENAISLAAAYYANSLGKFMLDQIPNAKTTFELWQQEKGKETSLMSNLEKNQELKDILLNETPWVLDAEQETEQKHRLADFFDTNNLAQRTGKALELLAKLQHADGAWSWWEGMSGSFWMTVEISEMLVRLNAMTGSHDDVRLMLHRAFSYMQQEIAREVERLKEIEKKGCTVSFPTYKALQYLYVCALDGRKLPSSAQKDNEYLVKLLRKDIKIQDLYDKAVTAIVLQHYDAKVSQEYVQSLKEYTVYNEEKGRYYDTHRAGYSWRDYRIPTQVAAIEAIGRITPDDRPTLLEMQRWLLQEKRTTCWDTPINSVNAIYAFLTGNKGAFAPQERTRLSVDGKPLEMPRATAGLGYVKTTMPAHGAKSLTADKTSEGVSWGAVYAQFMQHTANIEASASGITVSRTIEVGDINQHFKPLANGQKLKVGDRVRVVITIEAERDYDFVQVIDRRAACMEPVSQLSGFHNGVYCAPKDNTTNYYYDRLPKGRHTMANEYYIDRAGTYETGTLGVECAYAPEYRAKAPSTTLVVEP